MNKPDMTKLVELTNEFILKLDKILETKGVKGKVIGFEFYDDQVDVTVEERYCSCCPPSSEEYTFNQMEFYD